MKLVVGNFKMNLTLTEINDYIDYFKDKKYSNVIFAPTSIYLLKFLANNLNVSAQDSSFSSKGAYTGDVSAEQLKSIGVKYSIVGHSERRMYYQDDKYVNEKLKLLLENNIIPILCIGETREEREKNLVFDVLKEKIDNSFKKIDTNSLKSVIIAYEPIWSIGTGVIPNNNEIEEVIKYIKDYINEHYGIMLKVLYGGSVNNNNINTLESIDIIDGYLVGGCSINKEEFNKLIKTIV